MVQIVLSHNSMYSSDCPSQDLFIHLKPISAFQRMSYICCIVILCSLYFSCFVIDNGGYIISHPDFVGLHEEDYPSIQNVHITQKEPDIAAVLAQNGILLLDHCIHFRESHVHNFYRV